MKFALSMVLVLACACGSPGAVRLKQLEALARVESATSVRREPTDCSVEWSKLSPSESRLVQVVDGETGEPVANAWVEIAPPEFTCLQERLAWDITGPSIDEKLARFGQRTRTDERGEARIPLPVAYAEWVVARDGVRFGLIDPRLDRKTYRYGDPLPDVVCVRLWRDETVAVRVVTPSGHPAVGAGVMLRFRKDGKTVTNATESDVWWWARVRDLDGRVAIPHVQELRRRCPDGAEAVLVAGLINSDPQSDPMPAPLVNGDSYELTVPDCGSIHVRMRRGDGKPVSTLAHAFVTYLDEPVNDPESDPNDIEYPELPCEPHGEHVRMNGVPLGQHFRIEGIVGDDLRLVSIEIVGPERPGQIVEVELVASELLPQVRARLVRAGGEPLAHAGVWAAAESNDFEESGGDSWVPRWTDANGYVVFPVRCSNAESAGRTLEIVALEGVRLDDAGKVQLRPGVARPLGFQGHVPFEHALGTAGLDLGEITLLPHGPR